MDLKDQVALITGAGRGIGRSIAFAFAREGAKIAVTGRTKESRERIAQEIVDQGGQAEAFPLDVTVDDQVFEAVSQVLSVWGRIDILVNNAGVIRHDTPVWATTIEQWDSMMGVNLRGMFLCCHAVIPHMLERGKGVIINIGASSGRMADVEYGPYAASKWGVVGYTASLGRSLRPAIQVNGINPGWVDTDMARASNPAGDPAWSTSEEIAQTALFLATRAPRDMTGQFIDVFGSWLGEGESWEYHEFPSISLSRKQRLRPVKVALVNGVDSAAQSVKLKEWALGKVLPIYDPLMEPLLIMAIRFPNCDYSDVLRERDAEGDRAKAMALLDKSLAISRELGMGPLMERVLSRREILRA